jgi:WD40 repeat protein
MMKYKKRLSAKKKQQRNKLRRSGKCISWTITQSGGTHRDLFWVAKRLGNYSKFTCMAIHPVHPLLAICDDSFKQNMLYRIVERLPRPEFPGRYNPSYLAPTRLNDGRDGRDGRVDCIAFHPTLPLVAGIHNETSITVWNIQELVGRIDQVPLNIENKRNELREMIKRSKDATEIEELNEQLDNLKDPELNSFATTNIPDLKLSCLAFHPTMPFIVVGCTDYRSNPNLSIIKIFRIDDDATNMTEVTKNSAVASAAYTTAAAMSAADVTGAQEAALASAAIIIPIDEEDTVYDIESIVFSHDGVFLAATFGEKVRVWIFSPTENMKEIGNIDMKILIKSDITIVIKSLVFSPIEPILVIGFKYLIYLVGVEKSGLTVISTHTTDSEIVTLAFHPTLPLLACGLANSEIRYYVIYNDTLTELKFFTFKTSYRFNRIAFNKQFFVVCGDNDKEIFTYAIEDQLLHDVRSMLQTYKDNYRTAKLSLVRKGVQRDVRDVILNKAYPDGDAFKSIEPYKEIVGEKTFLDFIELLSDTHIRMKQLVQEFIDLLKISPNLPPVLVPFREIITNYYIPPLDDSVVIFDSADYIQTCDEIVQRFITENGLDPESESVKKIKAIFTNIVRILIEYQDTIKSSTYISNVSPQYVEKLRALNTTLMSVRKNIQAFTLEKLFPFLQQLFTLNQSAQNHLFIKDINLKEWFKYAKAERDFTINKLKSEDPSKYSAVWDDKEWNKILKELALKRANADARRRQTKSQGAVAQGGTRRKMRARTYKKYSYKGYKK